MGAKKSSSPVYPFASLQALVLHIQHLAAPNGASPAFTPGSVGFGAWDRFQKLRGFKQLLECHKPAGQRIYGSFSPPILPKDRFVGRFDPKQDRKTGVLYLNALYLEPEVEPDDELTAGVAAARRDFLIRMRGKPE